MLGFFYFKLKREQIILDLNVLPTKESQCRKVAKLLLEKQSEAWIKAVVRVNGKVPSGRIIQEVVSEIRGMPKIEAKSVTEKYLRTPGMETEYFIYSDRETYEMLEAYRQQICAATKNGAIKRLLDAENQDNN